MSHVILFDEFNSETVREIGGKGLNLCQLRQQGFEVPDGFCVTVAAFDAMCRANPTVESAIANWVQGDDATADLTAAWDAATIPSEILKSIGTVLLALGDEDVFAVRSSAVVEDSAQHSFAGQFATKLGISGVGDVCAALKECWASLFNETLRQHLRADDFGADDVRMAVVVQRMIRPRSAGVMFTVDPLSQDHTRLRIEANYGLGETLVSGEITPDSIVIDKSYGNIVDQQIAEKTQYLEYTQDGLVTSEVNKGEQGVSCLSATDIATLTAAAHKIEAWAGRPQDIEWAFDGPTLHIVQSRDITTLSDIDSALFTPELIDGVWTRENMDERYEKVATPFTISTLYPGLEKGLEATFNRIGIFPDDAFGPVIRVFYGRPYLNKTQAAHALKGIHVDNTQMESVLGDRGKVGFNPRLPLIGLGVLRMIKKSSGEWAKFQREFLDPLQHADETELATCDLTQLHQKLDGQLSIMDQYWVLHMLNVRSADFCQKILQALLEHVYPDKEVAFEIFCRLSSGFTENITFESDSAVYHMSRTVLEHPKLKGLLLAGNIRAFTTALHNDPAGAAILSSFDDLIAKFGYKLSNQEFADPQWRDDPEMVWRHIAAAMGSMERDPKVRLLEKKEDRLRAYDEVLAKFKGPIGWMLRPVFKWVYRKMCAYIPSRENDQFQLGLVFYNTKRTAHHMGERLMAFGALDTVGEIFLLERARIPKSDVDVDVADLKAYVSRQKERFATYQVMDIPFTINDPLVADAASEDGWTGYGVSKGTVTATSKIAHDPSELGALRDGDILVTHSTNPAWTPAFSRLGGLVTEAGGLLSHGAIMAREYNIPAVLGVRGITKAVTSGDTIHVNGTLGRVHVEPQESNKKALDIAAE